MQAEGDELVQYLNENSEKCLHLAATLAGQAKAEEEMQNNKLLAKAHLQEKFTLEAQNAFLELKKKIEKGTKLLIQTLSEMAYEDRSIMTQDVVVDMSKIISLSCDMLRDSSIAENVAKALFIENKGFGEICDMNTSTIETLYKAAKKVYEQKRYDDASCAFTVLCLLQTKSYALWFALANCEFLSERYDSALIAYAFAATSDLTQTEPHLYSCSCYEKQNLPDLAINALDLALIVVENRDELKELKQKIEAHKALLETQLHG